MRALALLVGLGLFAAAPAEAGVVVPVQHPGMSGPRIVVDQGGGRGHYPGNGHGHGQGDGRGHGGWHGHGHGHGPWSPYSYPFVWGDLPYASEPAPASEPAQDLAPVVTNLSTMAVANGCPASPVTSWAEPRPSGPRIIYLGAPPKGHAPRVIYGTD
jgi:hypothetical protein